MFLNQAGRIHDSLGKFYGKIKLMEKIEASRQALLRDRALKRLVSVSEAGLTISQFRGLTGDLKSSWDHVVDLYGGEGMAMERVEKVHAKMICAIEKRARNKFERLFPRLLKYAEDTNKIVVFENESIVDYKK